MPIALRFLTERNPPCALRPAQERAETSGRWGRAVRQDNKNRRALRGTPRIVEACPGLGRRLIVRPRSRGPGASLCHELVEFGLVLGKSQPLEEGSEVLLLLFH